MATPTGEIDWLIASLTDWLIARLIKGLII